MGNRRLTLAVPPFAIVGDTRNHGVGAVDKEVPDSRVIQQSSLSLIRDTYEGDEIHLEDWLNGNFPSLNQSSNFSIAVGFPKHSQPNSAVMNKRLRHTTPPPIASIGSNSLLVGKLPIQLTWPTRGEGDRKKTMAMPEQSQVQSSCLSVEKTTREKELEKEWPKIETKVFSPAHIEGISVDDLFSHSYTPPPPPSPSYTSEWVWVPKTRVWDLEAPHFSTSAEEIRKYGGQAKHIRRAQVRTTDERSFVEVVKKKKMDRRAPPAWGGGARGSARLPCSERGVLSQR